MKNDIPTVILLIKNHRKLGFVLHPYLSTRDNLKIWVVEEYFTRKTSERYQDLLPVEMNELVRLCEEYSDLSLARRFSPRNTTVVDFLNGVDETMISTHIRPLIDKQISAILHFARKHNIPLFQDEGSQLLYPNRRIEIQHDIAEPTYHFTKTNNGSNYQLKVSCNDKQVLLNHPGNLLIANFPCWLLSGRELFHFPDYFNGKRIKPFLIKDVIGIPESAEKKFFETIITKDLKSGNVTADGFEIIDRKISPRLELSLEQDWQGISVLIAWFVYDKFRILAGKKQKVFVDLKIQGEQYSFSRIYRDFEQEKLLIGVLLENGLVYQNENSFSVKMVKSDPISSLYLLVEWINKNTIVPGSYQIKILQPDLSNQFFLGTINSEIKMDRAEDWFDIFGNVCFGNFSIPFLQLKDLILGDIRTFLLPNGETAVLPVEWFSLFRGLFLYGKEWGDGIRLNRFQFPVVEELLIVSKGKERNDFFDLQLASAPPADIPETLIAKLRHYQEEGLQWMQFLQKNQFGGCLADDMGLGKTVQTIALLLSQKRKEKGTSLIVMPTTLLYNWQREIEKFAPTLRYLVHAGPNRPQSTLLFDSVDVILTTYGIIRQDLCLLSSFEFFTIILDESQVIKNPEAQITGAVSELQGRNRFVLTGTPIENSLTDLWSQMNFSNPGLLGDLRSFQKEYLNINEKPKESVRIERLRRLIRPFLLRRTKLQVEPDLPPLTLEIRYCEMNEMHRKAYETELSGVRRQVLENLNDMKTPYDSIAVLNAILRLRQLANHPKLKDAQYEGESGKFNEVMDHLETLLDENQKVLIFSSFVEHLKIFEDHFVKEGMKYLILTGSTTNRQVVIDRFKNDPEIMIFLISLKAGGLGLNLTEAGYVCILDPWWNPAAERQAMDRTHRIGQEKNVFAYRFITKDTIEEKIVKLQEKKQWLSDTFVVSENPLKNISREEIVELFS